MTNAEARLNKLLRPRKPEGSLGRTAQDVHLDSHTAPELCCPANVNLYIYAFAQQLSSSIFIRFRSSYRPLYLCVCPIAVSLYIYTFVQQLRTCVYVFAQQLSASIFMRSPNSCEPLYLCVCPAAVSLDIYAFAQQMMMS